MGALYQEIILTRLRSRPLDLGGESCLVFTGWPVPSRLSECFKNHGRLGVVLPGPDDGTAPNLPGMSLFFGGAGPGRGQADLGLRAFIRDHRVRRAVFLAGGGYRDWSSLIALRRLGLKAYLEFLPGPRKVSITAELLRRSPLVMDRLARRLTAFLADSLGRPMPFIQRFGAFLAGWGGWWLSGRERRRRKDAAAAFARAADRDNQPSRPLPPGSRLRIVHCISELGPGGSEGQLTSLAVALKRAGHDVRVVQTAPREQSYERYRARLKAEAIPFVQAGGGPADGFGPAFWSDPRLPQGLFPHLPPEIGAEVLDLMGEFLLARPDVVHTWSDQSNLAGGLAAYLSGVPRIVIGLRSVNPTRFIPLQAAWMRTWYQVLARSSRVRFAANSRAGALDYAAWLGLSPERIKVVYNGLDLAALAARPDDEAVAFRQEAGLPPDGRLLGGVLRWCPEKRPVDFLRVVKEVRQRIPTARAVLAGNGIDEAGARRAVRRLGLEGAVDLLGRRNDIARVMAACDAILLTSEWEGTPNVLLEAQALGVPVVAVNTGGVADALIPGQTGLLAGVGETDRLADHVVSLLDNRELRDRMGRRGREFVRERFSEDQFLTGHLSIYYS